MKITIEPSDTITKHGYITITMDTGHNDDTTREAVQMVLDAVVAYGHDKSNVQDNASDYGEL